MRGRQDDVRGNGSGCAACDGHSMRAAILMTAITEAKSGRDLMGRDEETA